MNNNIDIELYTQKNEINTNPPEIVIEITGLKSLNKFIGLEDTPIYYENGKFFKVENNKIVYSDITWEDIKGQVQDNPELKSEVEKLVAETARAYTEEVVKQAIEIHDKDEEAHYFIQNIIQQNYEVLNNKIDLNKIDTQTSLEDINNKIQINITNINKLDTYTQELNTKLEDLILEVDVDIKGDIKKLQDDLQTTNQEVIDNFEILDKKIDDNYNNLDTRVTTNENDIAQLKKDVVDNKTELEQNIKDNVDTINSTINNLTTIVDNNYTTLDTKIDNSVSTINTTIQDLETKVDQNKVDHDKDIQDLENKKADKSTTLEGYGITDAYTKSEIDTKVSSIYKVKGSVDTYADLPTENEIGDVYNILDTGSNYVWIGEGKGELKDGWDKLSETVDLSPYLLKSEAEQIYETIRNVEAIKELLELGVDTLRADVNKNTTNINNLTTIVDNNYTTLDTKIDTTKSELNQSISDLETKVDQNKVDHDKDIQDLDTKVDGIKTDFETAIKAETDRAENIEKKLQDSIDILDTRVTTNENDITNLQTSKQDNLTAGKGIEIKDNTVSNKLSIIFKDWSIE